MDTRAVAHLAPDADAEAILNSDPRYLRLLADMDSEDKRSPAVNDDGLVPLLLAPHVLRHLHQLATQHGWTLANKQVPQAKYQQLLDERRLNGVALTVLTQKVRGLPR